MRTEEAAGGVARGSSSPRSFWARSSPDAGAEEVAVVVAARRPRSRPLRSRDSRNRSPNRLPRLP